MSRVSDEAPIDVRAFCYSGGEPAFPEPEIMPVRFEIRGGPGEFGEPKSLTASKPTILIIHSLNATKSAVWIDWLFDDWLAQYDPPSHAAARQAAPGAQSMRPPIGIMFVSSDPPSIREDVIERHLDDRRAECESEEEYEREEWLEKHFIRVFEVPLPRPEQPEASRRVSRDRLCSFVEWLLDRPCAPPTDQFELVWDPIDGATRRTPEEVRTLVDLAFMVLAEAEAPEKARALRERHYGAAAVARKAREDFDRLDAELYVQRYPVDARRYSLSHTYLKNHINLELSEAEVSQTSTDPDIVRANLRKAMQDVGPRLRNFLRQARFLTHLDSVMRASVYITDEKSVVAEAVRQAIDDDEERSVRFSNYEPILATLRDCAYRKIQTTPIKPDHAVALDAAEDALGEFTRRLDAGESLERLRDATVRLTEALADTKVHPQWASK